MGLFRATIQHRRRVRLLVSPGLRPLRSWVNSGTITSSTSARFRWDIWTRRRASTCCAGRFRSSPSEAVPAEVAAEIYGRTAGQPYLLQLYGALLVTRLNEQSRGVASLEDIPEVEAEAMSQGVYYFRNTWQDTPPAVRGIIEDLALGKTGAAHAGDEEMAAASMAHRRSGPSADSGC